MRDASLALIVSILMLAGAGCRTQTTHETPKTHQNLRSISNAYLKATDERGTPPTNLDELLPYLKIEGDADDLLRSPDDGQKYVIHWGVDYRAALEGGQLPVLAYEQKGKDGKREVLQIRRITRMSDADLKQAPFPPGEKAPN